MIDQRLAIRNTEHKGRSDHTDRMVEVQSGFILNITRYFLKSSTAGNLEKRVLLSLTEGDGPPFFRTILIGGHTKFFHIAPVQHDAEKENVMRKEVIIGGKAIVVALGAICGSLALGPPPALATANLPYCMYGDNDVECDYYTYRQCQAASQNTGGSCVANPGVVTYASMDRPGLSSGPSTSGASEAIRQKCVARAQAEYPDNGLGTVTVMTQRTEVYASCARENGIRP